MNKSTVKSLKLRKAICAAGGMGLAIFLSITSNNAAACSGPQGSHCQAGSGKCQTAKHCTCQINAGSTGTSGTSTWGTCVMPTPSVPPVSG